MTSARQSRPLTVLVTGFGPFPGMPFNPTAPLVARLARARRPAFGDARLVGHVFPTSYAAVDRELPALIRRHRPDVLLMFGVAGRTRHLRIETVARNRLTMLRPDAAGTVRPSIRRTAPAQLAMRTPARRLLAAARAFRVPAALSRDAGHYLCNYLCWQATEAAASTGGPRLAAFVHVPNVRRAPVPRGRATRRRIAARDLATAGEAMLAAIIAAARQR